MSDRLLTAKLMRAADRRALVQPPRQKEHKYRDWETNVNASRMHMYATSLDSRREMGRRAENTSARIVSLIDEPRHEADRRLGRQLAAQFSSGGLDQSDIRRDEDPIRNLYGTHVRPERKHNRRDPNNREKKAALAARGDQSEVLSIVMRQHAVNESAAETRELLPYITASANGGPNRRKYRQMRLAVDEELRNGDLRAYGDRPDDTFTLVNPKFRAVVRMRQVSKQMRDQYDQTFESGFPSTNPHAQDYALQRLTQLY